MNRLPLLICLAATSCTTFSDLDENHPYDPACEPGFVENEAGECIPNNVSNEPNNVSNEPNNVSNEPNNVSNVPCEPQPGQCCPTPDGEYCCTDAGCCFYDPAECGPDPPNNINNPFLDNYMLVIVGAQPQVCQDQNGDGPDIFGIRVTTPNGGEILPYLATFQPGPGGQGAEDQITEVLQQPIDPDQAMQCPQGLSFSLGCGGLVGIGFQSDRMVDITTGARLVLLESGPQCDQEGDLYSLYVCPLDDPDIPNNCFVLGDAFEGSIDQELQL